MATELQIVLLGDVHVRQADEQDIVPELSTKALALFCYLVETGHTHQRTSLTGLLWGEKPEEDARRSLRVELTKMRRFLNGYLDTTRQTARFSREAPYWLDTEAFEHFLQLAQTAVGAAQRAYLREAVTLYTGEFMAGFMVSDAPDFEEWILVQRERYRQGAIQALDQLTAICLEQKDHQAGIEYAQQLLAIDPWREEAHQQLMQLYALAGQRSAALRQYEICREVLAEELGIEPSPQTKALMQQIRDGERAETLAYKRPLPAPTASTPAVQIPFQAPALVPYFQGRDDEMEQLGAMLLPADAPPVISLVGMGGIGKSSVAIQLAHDLRRQFADGVLWADAAHSEPASIAANWASAYGYDFHSLPTMDQRLAALRQVLADKQVLIVLDDVTVAARVKPLLPQNGRFAILITTRNADIATALGAEIVALSVLTPGNGRSLLASLIGRDRVQAESRAAEQIGERLHYLPLAMAIAGRYLAARPRRSLDSFAGQLSLEAERLELAVGDTAVRTSFTISWQGLDEEHKRVFALLAVFNGRHFSPEAIAHIAEMDSYLVQDRLDRLVSLSLLNEQAERYYRQHPLLADFSGEKLGSEKQPLHRMVDYFLQFAQQNQTAYALLTPEWENLDAALMTANRLQRWPDVIAFSGTLHAIWFARGRFDWARRAHETAVTAAQTMQDPALEARSLLCWGQAALEQGDLRPAGELLRRSLGLYRQLDDPAGVADCLHELARIAQDLNQQFAEAEQLLAECRQIREQLGDPADIADVLYRQAKLATGQSQWEKSRELSLQALALYESLGKQPEMVRTLRNLFWTYIGLLDIEQAQACADDALAIAQETDDLGELALAIYCQGEACRRQKKLDEALRHTEESLELLQRMGDRRSISSVLFLQFLIQRDARRFAEARRLADLCLDLFQDQEDRQRVMWILGNLGIIHFWEQRLGEADRCWEQSLVLAQEIPDPVWQRLLTAKIEELKSDASRNGSGS
ncbi:MAG: hypothetical protein KC441_09395 [Anaerolineales bacterium]|nr:hypothetical protein [Anaerolineales bacterium]